MATTPSKYSLGSNASTNRNGQPPDIADTASGFATLEATLARSTDHSVWEWNAHSSEYREMGLWQHGLGYSENEAFQTFDALLRRIHPDDQENFLRTLDAPGIAPAMVAFIGSRIASRR
ncbi:MAG: hypothetical protein ACI9BW_000829 [Gammaproteobacteria bacterium]|jgi:hypothetical protein